MAKRNGEQAPAEGSFLDQMNPARLLQAPPSRNKQEFQKGTAFEQPIQIAVNVPASLPAQLERPKPPADPLMQPPPTYHEQRKDLATFEAPTFKQEQP